MIAFGCATSDERRFRAGAAKAIEAVAERDSLLMRRQADGSLAAAYDEMLAEAATHEDLEALVLVDQSVSRLDGQLPARLRGLLAASADVAVIGTAAVDGAREVESVPGVLVVLSAWAVRELRCNATVAGALDPLAMDLCFQARAHGRRVVGSGALGVESDDGWAQRAAERRTWVQSTAAARRKWGASRTPTARPVCVLGVGRSGTSLVARALNLLGVDLGEQDTMLSPSEVNPKGYWEQREVVELNGEILTALGGDWWCPPPRPPGWELAEEMAGLRDRLADLVKRHFDTAGRWGFKDPRTTFTLPMWRSVVGAFDYVICVRNPLEVAASAEGVPEDFDEIALWLHYGCEALRATAGQRRTFVFYEEWLDDADGVTDRLGKFLHGSDWDAGGDLARRASSEWDPGLRRRRASDADLAASDDLSVEARAFHFLVRSLAKAEREGHRRAPALQAIAAALDRDVVVPSQRSG